MNESLTKDSGGWAEIEVHTGGGPRTERAQVIGPFAVSGVSQPTAVTHLRTGMSVRKFDGRGQRKLAYSLARHLKERCDPAAIDTTDHVAVGQYLSPIVRAWSKENGVRFP